MAFDNVYTPSNTENLGVKYQRIDDNFGKIDHGRTIITSGTNRKIDFNVDFGDLNYTVVYQIIGTNNQPVLGWTEVSFQTDGFTIDIDFNCTVRWHVIHD